MISHSDLQARLTELCAQFQVPGAAVAGAAGDESVVAWTGTAHRRTGLPVARDTLFAAGSVTKVFTASLVMSLVDEGLVDLDAPVSTYLPEIASFQDTRAAEITVRMLINHTSGLAGSVTWDLPRGPQVTAQFVERLSEVPLNSPPGAYWSYSNGGLVMAGRVAEVATGLTFDDALAERILRPLSMNATSELDQMLLQSTAVGHVPDSSGVMQVVPRFQLGTNAPSGSALVTDIDGLLAFARMHLDDGRAQDGTQVLSSAAVKAMQQRTVDLPWGMGYDHCGLGWMRRDTSAGLLVAHTGASAGQHSSLTVLPDQQGVFAALTNGIGGPAVYGTLQAELMQDLFGVAPPMPPTLPEQVPQVDLEPLVGTYVADEGHVVLGAQDGKLTVRHEYEPAFVDTMQLIMGPAFPPPPALASPYAPDGRFLADSGLPVQFVRESGEERPSYVYVGRLFRRG